MPAKRRASVVPASDVVDPIRPKTAKGEMAEKLRAQIESAPIVRRETREGRVYEVRQIPAGPLP